MTFRACDGAMHQELYVLGGNGFAALHANPSAPALILKASRPKR
jgi:hypothetical protein